MLKIKSKQIVLVFGDILLLGLALYLALTARYMVLPLDFEFTTHLKIFSPLIALLVIFYYSFDFYGFSLFQTRMQQLGRLVNVHAFVAVVGLLYFYLFSSLFTEGLTPKTILVLYTLFAIVLHVLWRLYVADSFMRPKQKVPTLLIAEGKEFDELKEIVNGHDFYPFYFVDHLRVDQPGLFSGETTLDEKLKSILESNDIRQVIVDIRDPNTAPVLSHLYNLASQRKIDVFDALKVYQDITKKMPLRGIGHFWFFESVRLNIQAYEAAKRVIDIVLAIPWLIIWFILHPFIYIAIKLDSKGDVFISQERYGLGGKVIKIYKYRTMENSDSGKWLKDKDMTNKITRVGRILRKTSVLDELPQMLSVLKGDISFVGPRPDMLSLGGRLSAQIPFYMMRYSVRPGLSGWAQVTQPVIPNSLEENIERFQYDLYYIKHRSTLLDLIVIVKTCKALIVRFFA